MPQFKSITTLVILPVMVSLSIILILGFSSVFTSFKLLDNIEHVEGSVIQAEREIADVLSDFKTQVQEWKNVLLRGFDQGDREKYWGRFQSKEQAIQTVLERKLSAEDVPNDEKQLIREFMRAHQHMAEKYREGYQLFVESGYDPKVGDAAVRGIDRQPAKLLARLSEKIGERAGSAILTLDANTRNTLTGLVIGIVILTILTVIYVVSRLRRQVIKPIKQVAKQLNGLAMSNYDVELTYQSGNELGVLADSARTLQSKLIGVVNELSDAEVHIQESSSTLTLVSQDIHDGSIEQGNASERLNTATQGLEHCVLQLVSISEQVGVASQASSRNMTECYATFEQANDGFTTLASTVNRSGQIVEELQKRSADILGVVNVINEIADQTNLLALNAAIEAARAGEQGRGFAVVADEVRALAAKTQQSTMEINAILSSFEQEAQTAVKAMETGKSLSESNASEAKAALAKLKGVLGHIEQTASAVHELQSVTDQQSQTAEGVSDVAQRIAALAEQYKGLAARRDITEHMDTASTRFGSVVSSLKAS